MEYVVSKLQEIVRKVQYYSKLNFKNPVDIDLVLETEGMKLEEINKLISAGIKIVAFSDFSKYLDFASALFPCRKFYIGEIYNENLSSILSEFERIESIVDVDDVARISFENACVGRVVDLMIKINVLSSIKKFGFSPAEAQKAAFEIVKYSGVRLIGMQTYIPPFENVKMRKTALRKAGTVFKLLNNQFRGMKVFSVNYTGYFEEVLAEGVNELRLNIKNLV